MKFSELGLHPTVYAGVEAASFVDCTPIQESSIPHILAGRDVAGLAQTGTGKTAAFVLPLIDRIIRARENSGQEIAAEPDENTRHVPFKDWRVTNFILVLVPTRELAEQVYENVAKFGKSADVSAVAIYGGTGYETQKAAIKSNVDFIVATPGRLIDLYKEHLLDLTQVRAVVFDEADRMFDMGFKDDMKYILRRVPQDRQFLVFSATLNFDVLNTAYEFGANPIEVNVSRDQAKAENVTDDIFHVGHNEKPQFLLSLLKKTNPKQAIIFSNFKHNVERIAKFLSDNGVPAMGISSLISQNQRTRIMEMFKEQNNDRNILVATDVAARGLDIKGVDLVINFELPDDAENYVHRIGRTGRAGAKGTAFSLVSDRDVEALTRIENYLGHKVNIGWMDEADLIKEFKEFPRDTGRRDVNRDGRAPHAGVRGAGPHRSRDGRPGRDGGKRFDRGPRSERGPRADRGPGGEHGHSRGGERPHRHESAERGPRHEHASRQHSKHGHQQGEHQGQRHGGQHSGGPQGGGGQHPHRQGGRHQGQHRHGQRPHHGGQRDRNQQHSYKFKPGQQPQVAKPKQATGIAAKVTGFFKKLFGG